MSLDFNQKFWSTGISSEGSAQVCSSFLTNAPYWNRTAYYSSKYLSNLFIFSNLRHFTSTIYESLKKFLRGDSNHFVRFLNSEFGFQSMDQSDSSLKSEIV